MSMPTFPENNTDITRCQAFNMLLGSIAMEELALSHIMNAEGEKLQYFLGTLHESTRPEASAKEILEVNQSISTLLENVAHNQYLLKGKLAQVLAAQEQWECPCSPPCPCPCKCEKTSVYHESRNGIWCEGQRLSWRQTLCDTCSTIAVPKGTCFISLTIELSLVECGKAMVALSEIYNGRTIVIMKSGAYSAKANEVIFISACTVITGDGNSSLAVSLCDPSKAMVKNAQLTVTLLGN